MNAPVRQDMEFDLEAIVSLETIRAHTKTMDIATVTDDQLRTYRESAFEAAQQFTGLWLRGKRWVTEPINVTRRCKEVLTHKTKYPVSDGWVYIYGSKVGTKTQFIGEGKRSVEVFLLQWDNYAFNTCCNPCSEEQPNRLMYQTGFGCSSEIPSGVVVGMLKYIAFNVANPGDIGNSVVNDRPSAGTRVVSNDPVVASGAASEWRRYVVGGF